MGSITLQIPVAGNQITAGLHASNYNALQTLLNGNLDSFNLATSSVGTDELAALAVTNAKIANSTIVASAKLSATGTKDSTTFLRGDDTWAIPGATTFYRKVTEKDVTNTVAETDLLNGDITIGAGVMSTNKTARVSLIGDIRHNSGVTGTATVRIKLGGTTLYADDIRFDDDADRRPFVMRFEITNLGAANSNFLAGTFFVGSAEAATTGIGNLEAGVAATGTTSATASRIAAFASNGATSVDTSAAVALVVTIQWSAAHANTSWKLRSGLVEVL